MPDTNGQSLSASELHARAEILAQHLDASHAAWQQARQIADELFEDMGGVRSRLVDLPRFSLEVTKCVEYLASDIADGARGASDFDLERLAKDGRDLLDLIDLASAERRAA